MSKSNVALLCVTVFILFAPVIVSATARWHYMSTINRLSRDPPNKVLNSLEKRTKWRMTHVHWASAVTGLICIAVYYCLYLLISEKDQLQKTRGSSGGLSSSRKTTTSSCSTVSKQLSFGSTSGLRQTFTISRKQKASGRLTAQSAMQKSQAFGSDQTKATTMRQVVSLKNTKAT
ncbi:hypothetical protein M514_02528 [Trichuris suis]|uniref:Uncharacterized protein n=1 Tax=Trichuris suis TaxID=68888 RepID=A0A085NNA7_9BILA|nr:hypothetical protein M513_02528 [Trichuris suis]KFD70953.1 hypothetical protein M514_02528 [Trichuris suis]KHJ48535.1 hypothetical protein D918_00837 [Trichuris suis]